MAESSAQAGRMEKLRRLRVKLCCIYSDENHRINMGCCPRGGSLSPLGKQMRELEDELLDAGVDVWADTPPPAVSLRDREERG